jgi:hypothetical protein
VTADIDPYSVIAKNIADRAKGKGKPRPVRKEPALGARYGAPEVLGRPTPPPKGVTAKRAKLPIPPGTVAKRPTIPTPRTALPEARLARELLPLGAVAIHRQGALVYLALKDRRWRVIMDSSYGPMVDKVCAIGTTVASDEAVMAARLMTFKSLTSPAPHGPKVIIPEGLFP